jgi:hypothetical protein
VPLTRQNHVHDYLDGLIISNVLRVLRGVVLMPASLTRGTISAIAAAVKAYLKSRLSRATNCWPN